MTDRPGEPAGAAVKTLDAPWSDGNGDEIERGAGDAPPIRCGNCGADLSRHPVNATGHVCTPPVDAQPVEPLRLTVGQIVPMLRSVTLSGERLIEQDFIDIQRALDAARAGDGLLRGEDVGRAWAIVRPFIWPFVAEKDRPAIQRNIEKGAAALAVEGSER